MTPPFPYHDLLNPETLPDRTEKVTLVQTHISLLFIADHFVYKIKKPVDFGFLDFTSLDKRLFFCRREIELNRRLTNDIYLGIVPVTRTQRGLSLRDPEGEVVDYAVKMRRIPEERLMKSLFLSGRLTQEHLKEVARVLAEFHQKAERSPEIEAYGTPEAFRLNTDENFAQVEPYVSRTIRRDTFSAIREWTEVFYRRERHRFETRVREGRIRDCHGDLHMEHVFLAENPQVFDCIEFNDRFRYGDTLADIAFLIMDLEYHGGKAEAEALWKGYRGFANEGNEDAMLRFYKIYRAFVRGKVIGFQLDEPALTPAEKAVALDKASRYYQLASSYMGR
jgi:hypothetical protein